MLEDGPAISFDEEAAWQSEEAWLDGVDDWYDDGWNEQTAWVSSTTYGSSSPLREPLITYSTSSPSANISGLASSSSAPPSSSVFALLGPTTSSTSSVARKSVPIKPPTPAVSGDLGSRTVHFDISSDTENEPSNPGTQRPPLLAPATPQVPRPLGGMSTQSSVARTALLVSTILSIIAPSDQFSLCGPVRRDSAAPSFSFPAFPCSPDSDVPSSAFHSVRGRTMHGWLIDTGAAQALMGTDTLSKFCTEVLSPQGLHVDVNLPLLHSAV